MAENAGIELDIEVEQDPAAIRKGHDPRLEKAMEVLLDRLRQNPPPKHQRPVRELTSARRSHRLAKRSPGSSLTPAESPSSRGRAVPVFSHVLQFF